MQQRTGGDLLRKRSWTASARDVPRAMSRCLKRGPRRACLLRQGVRVSRLGPTPILMEELSIARVGFCGRRYVRELIDGGYEL